MALLKAASEHGSFDVRPALTVRGLHTFQNTTIKSYDANYVRGSLELGVSGNNTAYWALPLTISRTDLWLHCDLTLIYNYSQVTPVIEFVSETGVPLVDICAKQSGSNLFIIVRSYDGTSYTVLSTDIPMTHFQFKTLDVRLDMLGTIEVYTNGALAWAQVAAISATSQFIKEVRWRCHRSIGTAFVSQCILADESTLGWKLRVMTKANFSGNESFFEWAGTSGANRFALSIDATEVTYDESTFIQAGSANKKSTITPYGFFAPFSEPPGGPQSVVAAVFYGTMSNVPVGAVADTALMFLKDGVLTLSPALGIPKTDAVVQRSRIYPVNPNTGIGWVHSDLALFEWGVITT